MPGWDAFGNLSAIVLPEHASKMSGGKLVAMILPHWHSKQHASKMPCLGSVEKLKTIMLLEHASKTPGCFFPKLKAITLQSKPQKCDVGRLLGNPKPCHCQSMPSRFQVGKFFARSRQSYPKSASPMAGWGRFGKLKAILLPDYASRGQGQNFWQIHGHEIESTLSEYASQMPGWTPLGNPKP